MCRDFKSLMKHKTTKKYEWIISNIPFLKIDLKIDQKFRNGLWLFVQEQKAIVFKNNRLLFFLLFIYCFVI